MRANERWLTLRQLRVQSHLPTTSAMQPIDFNWTLRAFLARCVNVKCERKWIWPDLLLYSRGKSRDKWARAKGTRDKVAIDRNEWPLIFLGADCLACEWFIVSHRRNKQYSNGSSLTLSPSVTPFAGAQKVAFDTFNEPVRILQQADQVLKRSKATHSEKCFGWGKNILSARRKFSPPKRVNRLRALAKIVKS